MKKDNFQNSIDFSFADDVRELALKPLKDTLSEFNINANKYSLLSYRNGAICLDSHKDDWVTYYGQKGQKTDAALFKKLENACVDVIKRLTISSPPELRQNMLQRFEEHKNNLYYTVNNH